ncbi:elongator complex protein 1-like, partial [Diaphorina citri]|uniref:Elongator complex protein 1-like n=1 Tax=Diaphorina citri TaxID=121845 RepID=A0A1S4ENI8_DIACI
MKNLCIFDQKDTALPFHSVPIEQNENNIVKFLLLDNGKIFLYDNSHLYHYKDHKLECWYETHFKIDQIFSDELLNVFYIISDQHIRSISYENDTKCYDTDLWALQENIDVEPDDEIITAALSPDKEHLILLTKSCLVITLSTNFTLISQQDVLSTSERGEKESVNVGWGKVETQFHGSAKNAAQSSA